MIPDLIDATTDYWKKLDELEAAYQQNEVSLSEVDARVQELMQEFGRSRRKALTAFWASFRYTLRQQGDAIAGVACIVALACVWLSWLQS